MIRVALRALAGLLAIGLVAGCMSIPLATMWQLRSFEVADLAALDPAQVRVAGLIEPGSGRIDTAKSTLTVKLSPKGGGTDEVHAFGHEPAPVQGGPILPTDNPRWEVLQLDAAGLAAMRKLQPRLTRIEDDYAGWSLSVSLQLQGGPPKDVPELRFSVRVQLADDQAPMTLFDRARVPVDHDS